MSPSGSSLAITLAMLSCLPGCSFCDPCDEELPANATQFERELWLADRAECERFQRELKDAEERAKRERRREDD